MRSLVSVLVLSVAAASQNYFKDFVPHDESYTCTNDLHATPFNRQVRGTNLGGWLVLEPWISPSLFYQFLGSSEKYGNDAPKKTGMDMYTFCESLGPNEGNRQLQSHWSTFVTTETIDKLASYGINSLRIPVGDWMFSPYGPYKGCTDGATEHLDRVLDLCAKHGIDVLIDIHGHIGSQNGFDNSGKSSNILWTFNESAEPDARASFQHWEIRSAGWLGTFDPIAKAYTWINESNIDHSHSVVEAIVKKYRNHSAILGIQPMNEPWEHTEIDVLKRFYWKSYKMTKSLAPAWKFVVHDSFRFDVDLWAGFMKGCPDVALDTHIYQAWQTFEDLDQIFSNACQMKDRISRMENLMMPVIVGEWSLATDNCAMWLNGFNDNLPGYPKVKCSMIDCPPTYLPPGQPGTPLNKSLPLQGPYGTGKSGPIFGKCPIGQVHDDVKSGAFSDNEIYTRLAYKKINAFSVGHGWYFWNFWTELAPRWSFMHAMENKWFPKNVSELEVAKDACELEDQLKFNCVAKRDANHQDLQRGLNYACSNGIDCTTMDTKYPDLLKRCDHVFNQYWQKKRMEGATCDFGGVAKLQAYMERNDSNTAPEILEKPMWLDKGNKPIVDTPSDSKNFAPAGNRERWSRVDTQSNRGYEYWLLASVVAVIMVVIGIIGRMRGKKSGYTQLH